MLHVSINTITGHDGCVALAYAGRRCTLAVIAVQYTYTGGWVRCARTRRPQTHPPPHITLAVIAVQYTYTDGFHSHSGLTYPAGILWPKHLKALCGVHHCTYAGRFHKPLVQHGLEPAQEERAATVADLPFLQHLAWRLFAVGSVLQRSPDSFIALDCFCSVRKDLFEAHGAHVWPQPVWFKGFTIDRTFKGGLRTSTSWRAAF